MCRTIYNIKNIGILFTTFVLPIVYHPKHYFSCHQLCADLVQVPKASSCSAPTIKLTCMLASSQLLLMYNNRHIVKSTRSEEHTNSTADKSLAAEKKKTNSLPRNMPQHTQSIDLLPHAVLFQFCFVLTCAVVLSKGYQKHLAFVGSQL